MSAEDRARPLRTPIVELVAGLGHLLALAGVLQLLEIVVGQNPLALPLGGAIAAELIAAHAGVTWSDVSDEATALFGELARAAAKGALPVALAVTVVVIVARAAGLAEIDAGHPSATVVIAVLRAVCIGARDELLFRGIPLAAAARARLPRSAAIAFGVLAGGASLALLPSVTPAAIALEIAAGLAFALLWRFGTIAGVAAHATWVLLVGSALHGSMLDVVRTRGALTVGAHADGLPAALGGAALLVSTFAMLRWARRRARSDRAIPPAAS